MSKKTTITMIPTNNSLVVARPNPSGKNPDRMSQISPAAGVPFEFTADEIADIKRLSPGAIRGLVNESAPEVTSDDEDDDGPDVSSVATRADPEPEPAPAPKPKKAKAAADDLGGL